MVLTIASAALGFAKRLSFCSMVENEAAYRSCLVTKSETEDKKGTGSG